MENKSENMANSRLKKLLSNNNLLKFTQTENKIGMSDKDKAIVSKCINGESFANLAREYNVSFNRIRKIVMKFKKRVKSVEKGKETYEY